MLSKVVALLVTTGCYADIRTGGTAPIGHGRGGAGADLALAVGGEHVDETLRVGGGIVSGARLADVNGYVPVGIDGHFAAQLTPYLPERAFNLLAVGHVSVGFAEGFDTGNKPMAPTPPSGVFNEVFAGIGVGATNDRPSRRVPRGHLAIGPEARWFRTDAGNSFWFVGAALEISLGFSFADLAFHKT